MAPLLHRAAINRMKIYMVSLLHRATINQLLLVVKATALKQQISNFYLQILSTLECGPMPNLMVALPNIGGALCSTPQSLADAHY